MKRAAVIGAGSMGQNHVRVYRELSGVELIAVADPSPDQRQLVTNRYGVRVYADYCELLERESPDVVSVVVPTQAHFEVVSQALNAGCDVLVEKPIAATVEEAAALMKMAADRRRVLTVGHVERHNPAILELKRRLKSGQLGRVFQIHARRLGPFPTRIRDVGVVVDLATHDLDIMRYLTGSEPVRLYAETRREIHTSNEDLFCGVIGFRDQTLGTLDINWLTPTKIRELRVTGELGMFSVDYLTQDLTFYENAETNGASLLTWNALRLLRGVSEGPMTRFALRKVEPLHAELESFLAAARGEDSLIASAYDGFIALKLALLLIESGTAHKSLEVAP